ncbi:hypothetical protein [Solicola sp. PLA-1-18]|uniref:hypothetical protein n=1 Tax=Solicola sp. PLA-1-18 TaxID=3380532 RepID=UPI003B81E1F6
MNHGLAYALMLGPVVVLAVAGLAVDLSTWPLTLALLAMLTPASLYIFGERLLIEQRIHERALVSHTRLPFRPTWVLPLAYVPPDDVRVEGRVDWTADHENVLPASGCLRTLPWGRVVRVPGPFTFNAKAGSNTVSVPRNAFTAQHMQATGASTMWAFSFHDPDAAAQMIATLAAAERVRVRL